MGRIDGARGTTEKRLRLGDRQVNYRLIRSNAARKLRVRVGPGGVEVVQPAARTAEEASQFLADSAEWILEQLDRTDRLSKLRRTPRRAAGKILYRGEPTRIRIERTASRAAGNTVCLVAGEIVVSRGMRSRTPVARSLELWLRREARRDIELHLAAMTARLGLRPGKVYVMGQQTKWGNCSGRRNLSFNWRLILAPEYVLRYLVTHEAVHLAVPDHSTRFWLTVQSLCRETERAKQWLCRYQEQTQIDLKTLFW